jgi:2',3'-cyclic-nucleotide 2'-phosphodiesterase (5'-nucleotidase family)
MAVLQSKHLPTVNVQLFPQLNDIYHIETEVAGRSEGSPYVLPRIGTLLQHARQLLGGDSVHLCVPGDFLNPSCLSKTFHGAQMVAVLKALGTRYVCFGNHEFDEGMDIEKLLARVTESKFTWLATNLQFADKRVTSHPQVKTWATIPLSPTLNLGLLGLIYEDDFGFAGSADPIEFVKLKFQVSDSLLPVRRPLAKERAWVALTHMTIEDDDRLARSVRRLLLIMGGHDHEYLRRQDEQSTMIVKALSEARSVRLNWILSVDRSEVDRLPNGLEGVNFELYRDVVIPSIMKILAGRRPAGQVVHPSADALLEYLGIKASDFLESRDVATVMRDVKTPLKGASQDAGLIVDAARVPIHTWLIGDDYVFLYSVALKTDDPTFARLVEEDPEVRKEIDKWLSRAPESSAPILRVPTTLHLTDELVRRQSTNFGNFVADVVSGRTRLRDRSRIPADVGLVNGGSFRLHRDIPPGEGLSEKTVCDILFHKNKILLYTLSWAELESILNACLTLRRAAGSSGHGDFLQISGIHVDAQGPDMLVHLILPKGDAAHERPKDTLQMATTEYVAQYCTEYRKFFEGRSATTLEADIKDAVVRELKAIGAAGEAVPDHLEMFPPTSRWQFPAGDAK